MKYFIPTFSERFPLNESVDAAKNYLLKRYAIEKNIKTSEIDEETKKTILNDRKFLEVKNLTAKNTGYTPMFTKFAFDQEAPIEDLRNILSELEKYKQNLKNDLPMPVSDYEKVVPDEDDRRPGWERLEDDLRNIELKRKLKKFYNEFNPKLKKLFSKATSDQIEELARASANLESIKKKKDIYNPNTKEVENVTAWRAFCFGLGAYTDTSTYPKFADPKYAIDKMIKDLDNHMKMWMVDSDSKNDSESRVVKEIKKLGRQVGIFYAKNGYIAVSVRSPKASQTFCDTIVKTTMCIRDETRFWSYSGGKVQFMFVNENLPDSNKYHLIGATVDRNQNVTDIYDRHNQSFTMPNGKRPRTLEELLRGMDYPEPMINSVLNNFKEEVDIKLTLENFFKKQESQSNDTIFKNLVGSAKSALAGHITQKEWETISSVLAEIIFDIRGMTKKQIIDNFSEAGIVSEAPLRVFDSLISPSDYTNQDIEKIIKSTEQVFEEIEYIIEVAKDDPGIIQGGDIKDLERLLSNSGEVIKKIKSKLK